MEFNSMNISFRSQSNLLSGATEGCCSQLIY